MSVSIIVLFALWILSICFLIGADSSSEEEGYAFVFLIAVILAPLAVAFYLGAVVESGRCRNEKEASGDR